MGTISDKTTINPNDIIKKILSNKYLLMKNYILKIKSEKVKDLICNDEIKFGDRKKLYNLNY